VKIKTAKFIPGLIAVVAILLTSLAALLPRVWPGLNVFRRLEWMTYDWRMRAAAQDPGPIATNLAAIFIDDTSLKVMNEAYNSFGFNWPWPRAFYGRLVKELKSQGARAVGFDIFLIERQPNYTETRVTVAPGVAISSDEWFAQQARLAGNVVLGVPGETISNRWHAILPAELFRTNVLGIAHATSDRDSDGVLRRAKAFKDDPQHGRIWHLGIVLGALELGLDLDRARVERDRIVLSNPGGLTRVIPLDAEGFFYIDWCLAWNDPRITKGAFEDVLDLEHLRSSGATNLDSDLDGKLAGKLVVVGSIGAGNNISDVGSTPLDKETYLVSKHWNVANSLITGRFIQPSPAWLELLLIGLLGVGSAVVTWRFRAPWPTLFVLAAGVVCVGVAHHLFVHHRLWLPLVLPVAGALLLTHVVMVTYQVAFEQTEKRRVRGIFSKLVSPEVVNELLQAEDLHLGGARREITVFFADVRGFTEFTDTNQARAEEQARQHGLTGAAAEAVFDEQARETLNTVNIYLATIADQIKRHNGTLDKYIGDCVMAFWGAPVPNELHAVAGVRAAIDAQRAMYALNQERFAENKRREQQNAARTAAGLPPLPPLPLLALGTGINTGVAIVGLMGSEAHTFNYTVFGREVNLASRLEGVSGRGRIIIGETTYRHLQRFAPELAAACTALPPVTVKGIQKPVAIYEVAWKTPVPAGSDTTVTRATAPSHDTTVSRATATTAAPAAKAS
jgi:adenylate cyclase